MGLDGFGFALSQPDTCPRLHAFPRGLVRARQAGGPDRHPGRGRAEVGNEARFHLDLTAKTLHRTPPSTPHDPCCARLAPLIGSDIDPILVQTYRRGAPDFGARVERTMLRAPGFAVAMLRTTGFALDYAALARHVGFRTRPRRRQLSILLAGRAYAQWDQRLVELRPGDAVISRQGTSYAEGYGGRACEALIVDWEDASDQEQASPVQQLVVASDLSNLRRLMGRFHPDNAAGWTCELFELLRALGLALELDPRAGPAPSLHAKRLYRLLGDTLMRLCDHPSLGELASALALSERQAHRAFVALGQHGHPFACWRDFLHEMRIDWATHLLSIPKAPLGYVAKLAGYRSTVALCHAFSLRGVRPPSEVARALAQRWG